MKSPQTPAKKQEKELPKARVMFAREGLSLEHPYSEAFIYLRNTNGVLKQPVAVLPLPKSCASLLVRVANMTEEQKILLVAECIDGGAFYENHSARHVHCSPNSVAYCQNNAKHTARAVLEAFGMIAKGGSR